MTNNKQNQSFLLLFVADVQQQKKKQSEPGLKLKWTLKHLSFQDKLSLSCPQWTPAQRQESRTWDAGWKTKHLTFQSVASMLWPGVLFCLSISSRRRQKAAPVNSTGHPISALRLKYSAGSQRGISLKKRLLEDFYILGTCWCLISEMSLIRVLSQLKDVKDRYFIQLIKHALVSLFFL